jgi:hypothetical protein
MPYQLFTHDEVHLIFKMSESRGGHAGARHVNLPSSQLWDRVEGIKRPGLALRTSFIKFDDQINAALQVLNDPRNDTELERFRVHAKASDKHHFEMRNLLIDDPIPMRYGIGGGAQVYPCNHFTLVLHKYEGPHPPPRQMLIVTFYGTMGEMV